MKNFLIIIMCLLTYSGFSQKDGKIKGFLGSEEYNIENESYIKFSFQKHTNENTSYKIKFFRGVGELSFGDITKMIQKKKTGIFQF